MTMEEPSPNEEGAARAVAEAEVKLEVTAEAFAAIPELLRALGFEAAGEERIADHYLQFRASPVGGFDFRRVRAVDGRSLFLTEKRWVRDAEGHAVRVEEERPLSPVEFEGLLPKGCPVPSLAKRRSNFRGQAADLSVVVSLDHLELQGRSRYFVECEVLSPPDAAHGIRERLLAWLRANLPVSDAGEAPTMLELLLEAGSLANGPG